MKKIKFILLATVVATFFIACNKQGLCKCTETQSDGSVSTYNITVGDEFNAPIPGAGSSKKELEIMCESNESSDSYSTTICELQK